MLCKVFVKCKIIDKLKFSKDIIYNWIGVCNALSLDSLRSCTKLLNDLSIIHSLSTGVFLRFQTPIQL